MAKTSHSLLKTSITLPQTYKTQTKEQNKQNFVKKHKLEIPTSKRCMLVSFHIDKSESPKNVIKEELILALEAAKIYTIVVGENPHTQPLSYVYFIDEKWGKDVQKIVDLLIWPVKDQEYYAMHHGTICVSSSKDNIQPYNAHKENGDGFYCKVENHWSLFAQIIRAEETFKFAYDWKHICQNAMDRSYNS